MGNFCIVRTTMDQLIGQQLLMAVVCCSCCLNYQAWSVACTMNNGAAGSAHVESCHSLSNCCTVLCLCIQVFRRCIARLSQQSMYASVLSCTFTNVGAVKLVFWELNAFEVYHLCHTRQPCYNAPRYSANASTQWTPNFIDDNLTRLLYYLLIAAGSVVVITFDFSVNNNYW